MEVHANSHRKKKMDPLFPGVSHTISRCVLRSTDKANGANVLLQIILKLDKE